MELDYFLLNTHRPLFSDVRLRQAVNYAIDRRALARLGNGFQPLPEHPTDHYLPPGMPGYRDARAYPLTPDLVKARALASGGGRTAMLYTCDVSPCAEQAQIVKTDLAAIGLQVQIKTLPFAKLFSSLTKPGGPFDLAWAGWVTDFPDPYGTLSALLEDSSIIEPTFNDPIYKRKLAAAARLSGPERYLNYGNLDLDLARNGAPWPLSATSQATTSSLRGSAARHSASSAPTSPPSAFGATPIGDALATGQSPSSPLASAAPTAPATSRLLLTHRERQFADPLVSTTIGARQQAHHASRSSRAGTGAGARGAAQMNEPHEHQARCRLTDAPAREAEPGGCGRRIDLAYCG